MSDHLRLKETGDAYRAHRASGAMDNVCALCSKTPKILFTHWKLISNDFPYDRIASVHDMIVPLRHITEDSFTMEERNELSTIKAGHLQQYDYIIEATHKTKSIPEHYHLHLIIGKEID